ncbi:hypothetical protein KUTeg_012620 [Tegillarca granosa]|uniref:Uncharacterized protein n=1 Tax=Tegillarca granosa TaxID=220873 RepID=A0ABQ9F5B7_TEGGR|nr:hypothetical protein KUTeg_012620 [Tegillarca granosa]
MTDSLTEKFSSSSSSDTVRGYLMDIVAYKTQNLLRRNTFLFAPNDQIQQTTICKLSHCRERKMSLYRNVVWFVKGMKEYTKGGYAAACKSFNAADLEVDVTGKRGTVHMVCRDSTRGEDARAEIENQTGNKNVFLHQLDMSKPRDVYKFAQTFENSGKELDVLHQCKVPK